MDRMKLIFILIALAAAVAVSLGVFTVKNASAAAYSGAAVIGNKGSDILLKRLIIRVYLKKVPVKFKKYFHFGNFHFNMPYKNFNFKNLRINIADTRYSGYHTALIKIINRKNG